MKKKAAVLAISYLSAAVLGLGVFAGVQTVRAENALRAQRYTGECAFQELRAAVNGMNAALEKSRYAVSPGFAAALCAETQSQAQAAAAALGALPFSTQEMEQTAAFLSKAGDYAGYLLRQAGGGEAFSAEELKNLQTLSASAALLADNLAQLQTDMTNGLVGLDAGALQQSAQSLSASMLSMEQEFPEFPTLVYDGPFSSDVGEGEALMLRDADEITADDALLIAGGFLGLPPNRLQSAGRTEGRLPVWRVASADYTVTVSVRGGYVISVIGGRAPGRTVLDTDTAREAARQVLASHGYRSMSETYHMLENNLLTVSFCYRQGEVLCYPDMVKVSIAMDTGELAGFDAAAYVTNHAVRTLPEAAVTAAEARKLVSPDLTILSENLTVIPAAGAAELLCREFVCRNGEGRHYLVYVNAVTGAQERILILLEDENGTLAI